MASLLHRMTGSRQRWQLVLLLLGLVATGVVVATTTDVVVGRVVPVGAGVAEVVATAELAGVADGDPSGVMVGVGVRVAVRAGVAVRIGVAVRCGVDPARVIVTDCWATLLLSESSLMRPNGSIVTRST